MRHEKEGFKTCFGFFKEEVVSRWAEYFKKILSKDHTNGHQNWSWQNHEPLTGGTGSGWHPARSGENRGDCEQYKSPGIDGIENEKLKYGGDEVWDQLHQFIFGIWSEKEITEDWKVAVICPIYNKGDKLCCFNYRDFPVELSLLPYKILPTAINRRLVAHIETEVW